MGLKIVGTEYVSVPVLRRALHVISFSLVVVAASTSLPRRQRASNVAKTTGGSRGRSVRPRRVTQFAKIKRWAMVRAAGEIH